MVVTPFIAASAAKASGRAVLDDRLNKAMWRALPPFEVPA